MRWLALSLVAVLPALSCQSAPPTGATGSASAGGAGGADACVPPAVAFPPPFHPQSSCCNGAACRGRCSELLTGNGEERVDTCHCGLVIFDGQAHHAPSPCAEGEECCVQPLGNDVCVPAGHCVDCTPERSSKWSRATCCAATTACRGHCGADNLGPCSCAQPGDGGCAEGFECCMHPLTGEHACVPWGECKFDLGPCPPAASSANVAVDCCDDLPCRGRCEAIPDVPPMCMCGDKGGGCAPDEECCLAPGGDNQDPATHCAPAGQCAMGG